MNTQASLLPVTRELVPEDRRMDVVERLFGMAFPLVNILRIRCGVCRKTLHQPNELQGIVLPKDGAMVMRKVAQTK